jgi:hypothetical protein
MTEVGRQVLGGSKATEIVRRVIIEKKNDDGDVESKRVLFRLVRCIFAPSDTDGGDLRHTGRLGVDVKTPRRTSRPWVLRRRLLGSG